MLRAKLSIFSKELFAKRYFAATSSRDWIEACIQLSRLQLIQCLSSLRSQIEIGRLAKLLTAYSKLESEFEKELELDSSALLVPLRSVTRMTYFLLVIARHFSETERIHPKRFVAMAMVKMLSSNHTLKPVLYQII